MDRQRFEAIVNRLEAHSREAPRTYQVKVGLLAMLGFGVLALVLGTASLSLLALVGLVVAIVASGGAFALVLLKLGKLVILLAAPLWYLVKSSLQALFVRVPAPQGEPITRAHAPMLFATLDDMRRRMKGPRFHQVLLVDDLNAAVVQRPWFGLIGPSRNYLLLGLPLLESLSPDEALAVVAHEYGHLAGSHGHFAAFIYRLRNTWATVQAHAEAWTGWVGAPLRTLVRWYAPYFNAYTFVLARANEYQADAASAELVSAEVAANALKRVNLTGPRYRQFIDDTLAGVRELPEPPDDLGRQWARVACDMPEEAQARRWLGNALEQTGDATNTHPSLKPRLAALPGQASRADELPPPLQGASAAQTWLGARAEFCHQVLDGAWARRVAQPWRERHRQVQAERTRLVELRELPERNADQDFERLRLQSQLEAQADTRDELAAFLRQHPEHAPALFLAGNLALSADDETGLALLDRAMARDADAIKPACERAYNFLSLRNDPRAEKYAERWRARDAHDRTVATQAATLDPKHRLHPHDLNDALLQRVHTLLTTHGEGVARAWLVRRELPADPSVRTYVLGITPTGWARFRGRQRRILERLVAADWPLHVYVVVLDGKYKTLKRSLQTLPGAALR